MSTEPPVADDDFAEFAEPPRQRPRHEPAPDRNARPADSAQDEVDAVLERLRRERAEGKR